MPGDSTDARQQMTADLLADLLMTIGAIILLLAVLLVAGTVPPEAVAPFRQPLIAERGGVRLGPGGPLIALDAILTDPALMTRLREAGLAGGAPLLVIAAEGRETAFLLDALAAQAGLDRMATVRLSADCATAGGRWQPLCQSLKGTPSR